MEAGDLTKPAGGRRAVDRTAVPLSALVKDLGILGAVLVALYTGQQKTNDELRELRREITAQSSAQAVQLAELSAKVAVLSALYVVPRPQAAVQP